ncbi:MAG: argininosuccinate synthase [Candidatus Methylarchaceae archaeon HK01B]|nr:argininosuccinate synthase [Candidatus Methylarchaceae archaeon HK01M]MCP8318518.1 argininosuccinate synthase [Candidatus Methylarchaceae archaeon HK01B]
MVDLTEKIVLAYSGGLDTSVAVKWLQEKFTSDIITVTVDVGQKDDFKEIERRAEETGAIKHYFIDAKEEFVRDYVFPSIKANALYQSKYPLSTALSRPLIASKLVEVAEKEGASAVAHGCTGKGNDQVRFEVTIRSLNPELKIIAPVREWNLSRVQEIEYAKKHGIKIEPKKATFSIDQNLWGRSIEGGAIEDIETEPPLEAFEWVKPVDEASEEAKYIDIEFEKGVPVSVDGEEKDPVDLISYVNQVAGIHSIGIIDHVEDRLVGIKSHEVYECPAALCIIEAHKDIEKLVLTRHELFFKEIVDSQWAWLVYSGLWLDPLRDGLDAFIDVTQERVKGKVKMKLYKGNFRVVGRSSRYSLYDLNLATYGISSKFDQSLARGFIELWGLPSRVAHSISKMSEDQK